MTCLLFIAAPPTILSATGGSIYVTATKNVTLTVEVSADPQPMAMWQLNGGSLANMTTTTLM